MIMAVIVMGMIVAVGMIVVMMRFVTVIMGMVVRVILRLMAMFVVTMFMVVMNRLVGVGFVRRRAVFAALEGLRGQRGINRGVLDDFALDPFALTTAARVAVARHALTVIRARRRQESQNAQQNVDRCYPPGRDPGGCGPRQSRRRI